MNQIFAGAAALSIAFLLWGLGKKPNLAVRKKNPSDFQTTTGLVKPLKVVLTKPRSISADCEKFNLNNNPTARDLVNLKEELRRMMACGPNERLQAIQITCLEGVSQKIALPILLRGLNDSNSQIVKEAAKAMEKYRGVPKAKNLQEVEMLRPPRNVALMR